MGRLPLDRRLATPVVAVAPTRVGLPEAFGSVYVGLGLPAPLLSALAALVRPRREVDDVLLFEPLSLGLPAVLDGGSLGLPAPILPVVPALGLPAADRSVGLPRPFVVEWRRAVEIAVGVVVLVDNVWFMTFVPPRILGMEVGSFGLIRFLRMGGGLPPMELRPVGFGLPLGLPIGRGLPLGLPLAVGGFGLPRGLPAVGLPAAPVLGLLLAAVVAVPLLRVPWLPDVCSGLRCMVSRRWL